MAYDVLVVANEFLRLAREGNGDPVGPLKLQKLVYLAHGWNLENFGINNPLIAQTVEAWKYGPVVPKLYREFKEFGASPITRVAPITTDMKNLDEASKDLLQQAWAIYGPSTAIQLSMTTHEPGFAWDLAIKASGGLYSIPIPNELILEEFRLRRARASEAV
jgi:uncharacterized phage-associated protein